MNDQARDDERRDEAHERQDNLRSELENQEAAMPPQQDVIELGPPGESTAGDSRDTGPGTGGATESDGRPRHNEGAHLGNQPNS